MRVTNGSQSVNFGCGASDRLSSTQKPAFTRCNLGVPGVDLRPLVDEPRDPDSVVRDVEVTDVSEPHTPTLANTVIEDAIAASPAVPEYDPTDADGRSPLDAPLTLAMRTRGPECFERG